MMNNLSRLSLAVLISISLFTSCQDTDKEGNKLDTPTSGNISITFDESLRPVAELEVNSFETTYDRAHLTPYYKSEAEAIQDLLNDSSRIIMITRQLNEREEQYFKSIEITPRTTKVAYDAVTLIVNNSNPDSTLNMQELEGIMTGKIQNWKELDPGNPDLKIQVVFDNPGSSTLSYLKNKFKIDSLPDNFFAMNSNPEVIAHVNSTPAAIGVIGLSWISDKDDSISIEFLNKIKVVGLSPPDSIEGAKLDYYRPFQAYIAAGFYPLHREVYIISREARSGLGTGFTSYVAGNQGQAIIRLAGLLPATMPIRVVNIKKELDYNE